MEPYSQDKVVFDCASIDLQGNFSMKNTLFVSLAVVAVSTSGALAANKEAKPTTPPSDTSNAGAAAPLMFGQVSDADRALYMKNQRDSGMKK
jgi:hypothetical protein